MLLLRGATSARNISSLSHISQYIYRAEYVLAFKRGCYWIMNVPKRPKFRMRGVHYFRQGSNNFVRFYITRPLPAPDSGVSAMLVYRLQRVPHVEMYIRSTAVTRTAYLRDRPRLFVRHSLLLSSLSFAKAAYT